ncbi:hypothetical protein C8A03DRAFT_34371 [Achaetomium macrosporum]|uniref:Uncharacterized protein n=1 Tax=Achaetomium macrosporum TaxID=79813 RepID=A0AAN7C914_9PEZI|nr:hypothetical protein C8A03DRAFT_34371 [Achaetomium macrosporum]
MTAPTTSQPPPITLRLPSKYRDTTTSSSSSSSGGSPTPSFTPPTLDFLHRTWTVTHSTLRMWRSARNVRITYGPLPPSSKSRARLSDLVEYESLSDRSGGRGVRRVAGVDTATSAGDTSVWDWRGSGWLFFVGSHWEVLGWGEREVPGGNGEGEKERWVVTWFAPTVFTAEGLDVYSDRREGGSEGLVREVLAELGRVTEGKGKLGEMVRRDMSAVAVQLPWKEA